MFPRLISAAPGSIGLAGISCLAIGYHGGIDAGAIAALSGAVAGAMVHLRAPDAAIGLRRQFILAAVLFTIHAVALYTFGAGGRGAVLPLGLQGTLALGAALLCATLGRRQASEAAANAPTAHDPEDTLEIDAAETRSSPALIAPPPAPVRGLAITGVAITAAFVLATVYWLEDEGPQARLAAADAGETTAGAVATLPAPPATEQPAQEPEAGMAELVDAPPPATSMPAITASDARRECMAQVETARLFLTLARDAASPAAYSAATAAQIERILKTRPVGPRTLARIAERMWDQRDAPEREANWWSGQYSRCEAARSSGTWYVVRG